MARRRYISTEISTDSKVAKLSQQPNGILATLLYTWMIPHAEDDGSITAEPLELALKVIPGIRQVSIDDVGEAIRSIVECELMILEDGRLRFPLDNFYKHQSNITRAKKDVILQGGTIEDWNQLQRNNYKPSKSNSRAVEKDSVQINCTEDKSSAINCTENISVQLNCNNLQKTDFRAPSPSPSPSPSEEGEKSTPLPPLKGDVPYLAFKALWNEVCGGVYKQIETLSDTRKRNIAARWKEHPDLEFWRKVFKRLLTAKHCMGENDRNWKADFDFIIQNNDKYTKLLEGKYDNPTGGQRSPPQAPPRPAYHLPFPGTERSNV